MVPTLCLGFLAATRRRVRLTGADTAHWWTGPRWWSMSESGPQVRDWRTTARAVLLPALLGVDLVGAVVAHRNDVRGEPLGVGRSLDVRRPGVVLLWGTGLSPPLLSLPVAAVVSRWPSRLRVLAALFAVGGMMEPVFWGRRPCPLHARVLVAAHVSLATILAVVANPPAVVASPRS